jgi:hypothetical protein
MKRCKVVSGPIDEAIRLTDVVVGSHSTGLLDSLAAGKPIAIIYTRKWGDYFELSDIKNCSVVISRTPEIFIYNILNPDISVMRRIKDHYLGENIRDGAIWVVDQLTS